MIERPILASYELSDTQRAAALARDVDVVVTAGAGTGKTKTLVARYLSLLDDGLAPRGIVAITFTRKAAQEMRNRVRKELQSFLSRDDLGGDDRERWQERANQLDAARIGTIHTLCSEILRTHPAEAALDPRFEVLEETQGALLRAGAIEAALGWAANDPETVTLFETFSERDLINTLSRLLNTPQQAQQAFDLLPDDIIGFWQARLAAAQQAQLDQWHADPAWQAAIRTLRANQADNLDDYLEDARRMALTAVTTAVATSATLADARRNYNVIATIALNRGSAKAWPGGAPQQKEVKAALKTLRDAVQGSLLDAELNDADRALAVVLPPLRSLFSYAAAAYTRAKQERNALDFDDLENRAIELLEQNTAVAHYWQSTIQSLLVDEFQDTNARQSTLIHLLCPDPGKLFIVGDAKQSIYRFRQADVAVFRRERAAVRAGGGSIHDLDTSFRTHAALGNGINTILPTIMGVETAVTADYEAPFEPLQFFHTAPRKGQRAPFLEVHLALGSKGDGGLDTAAAALAARLHALHDAGELSDWGEVAILCRASNAFKAYEDALDRASIPYVTVAGKGFYERPEIRDILNALRAIADPHDDLALAGLLRSPVCAVSDAGLYTLVQARRPHESLWDVVARASDLPDTADAARVREAGALVTECRPLVGRTAVADLLNTFLERTHFRAALLAGGETRAIGNVAKLLADAYTSGMVSVGDFLEYVTQVRDTGSREGEARSVADAAVQIMTIHAAKGLEFPLVVLGDINKMDRRSDGLLIDDTLGVVTKLTVNAQTPAIYDLARQADRARDAAESKRLLYVALTRAEDKLMLSGQFTLTDAGRPRLSGWLSDLAPGIDLSQFDFGAIDAEGTRSHGRSIMIDDMPAEVRVYEARWAAPLHARPFGETAVLTPPDPRMLADLRAADRERDKEDATPDTVWQIVPTAGRPAAPAWVVGALVHEALEAWRFPDAAFAHWAKARTRRHGINDDKRLNDAIARVRGMLGRLRSDPLFGEIDAAEERYHEMPFVYENDAGEMIAGVIDLLYRSHGRWHIIDFKTDRIDRGKGVGAVQKLAEYEDQVRGYATAVQHLTGERPQLALCFLNHPDGIIRYPVAPD